MQRLKNKVHCDVKTDDKHDQLDWAIKNRSITFLK